MNIVIHKESKLYLTPEKVREIMEGRIFNLTKRELENASENVEIINETILKEKLAEIKKLLSQCNCLEKENQKLLLEDQGRILEEKKKELGRIINEQSKESNCSGKIFKLEELYFAIQKEKNNKEFQVLDARKGITKVKEELNEKGVKYDNIQRICQLCEEIAKIESQLEEEQLFQNRIEFPNK